MSIITYGAVVHRAEVAAAQLEREGVSVEIIDLRSLSPFDWEAIAATVRKTNRVIVAYEDMLSWGYGAEIAARIADQLFDELDAPVRRVAAMDTFCAYQPTLEDEILPQTSRPGRGRSRIACVLTRAGFGGAGVPPAPAFALPRKSPAGCRCHKFSSRILPAKPGRESRLGVFHIESNPIRPGSHCKPNHRLVGCLGPFLEGSNLNL